MTSIGIILVLYNSRHNLELLFSSLSNQTEKDFKIYLIDNNDTYAEIDYSKKLNEKIGLNIEYMKSPENSGFAEGNNLGAQKALAEGCKYLFFLNNDTELEKDCIKILVQKAEEDAKIGATSPIILYWSEDKSKRIVQEYGSKVDFNKYEIKKHFEGMDYNAIENEMPNFLEVDLVSGAATFVRSEVLNKTGLWEERYFAYGDEIDLARRINNAGYKLYVSKDSIIWHNHKWSRDNKTGWYREYYLSERNKYLYYLKYNMNFYLLKSLLIDLVKFPWRYVWFTRKCDFKLGFYYLLGMFHGILNKQGKPKLRIIN